MPPLQDTILINIFLVSFLGVGELEGPHILSSFLRDHPLGTQPCLPILGLGVNACYRWRVLTAHSDLGISGAGERLSKHGPSAETHI